MRHLKIVARASEDIKDLTGEGLEYLIDKDCNILAIFSEGNMLGHAYESVSKEEAQEITKVAA